MKGLGLRLGLQDLGLDLRFQVVGSGVDGSKRPRSGGLVRVELQGPFQAERCLGA